MNISNSFESFNGKLFVSLILLFPIFAPIDWSANEYLYLTLAKYRVMPPENPNLYAAVITDNFRLFGDFFFGNAIKYLGIDRAWIFLRIFTWLSISFSYSYFVDTFKISALSSGISILIFLFLGQAYFGGEWIFGGVETKVFSYALVFIGLSKFYKTNYKQSIPILLLASYFHFLIGFFWLIVVLFIYLFIKRECKLRFFYYLIAIIPFIYLLAPYQNTNIESFNLGHINLTPNQIYSLRHKHHVLPFYNSEWLNRFIFFTFNLLAIGFLAFRIKYKEPISKLIFSLHLYLLFAFLISFFDMTTNYFGKVYLFRPASLIMLFMLLICADYIFKIKNISKYFFIFSLLTVSSLSLFKEFKRIQNLTFNYKLFDKLIPEQRETLNFISKFVNQNDVLLVEENGNSALNELNFELLTNKPSLVNWKFVPTNDFSITRWYKLNLLKRQAFMGDCNSMSILNVKYYMTYQNSEVLNSTKCLTKVFVAANYNIYRYK
jgi:hypothetical protein